MGHVERIMAGCAGLVLIAVGASAGPIEVQNPDGARLEKDVVVFWGQAARDEAVRRGVPLVTRFDGRDAVLVGFRGALPLYDADANLIAASTSNVDALWPSGSLGRSLDGLGVRIGQWESSVARSTHQEFAGRYVALDASAPSNHASHVAGTLGATGVDPSARGMASSAQITGRTLDGDTFEMGVDAGDGMRLSNHSYGRFAGFTTNTLGQIFWLGDWTVSPFEDYQFGYHDERAQAFDQVIYNNSGLLSCVAAMNERNDTGPAPGGQWFFRDLLDIAPDEDWILSTNPAPQMQSAIDGGYDTITAQGSAKNVLVVGAVEDVLVADPDPWDIVSAPFSGWGPADDGRIKPDIVANGVGVYSAISTADDAYDTSDGTSMATPTVTGGVALLLEQWRIENSVDPLASTMKAVLLHTTIEAGSADGPDYRFGWGLFDAASASGVISQDVVRPWTIQERTLLDSETIEIPLIADGGELRVTVVWTDPAGTPAPTSVDPTDLMLVNDLDARLIEDEGPGVYFPWRLDPDAPAAAATRGDNFRDNVEQLDGDFSAGELLTLRIDHKGLLSDGQQTFSLVVTGASPGAQRLYVDADRPGGNGRSWAAAFDDLQDALFFASTAPVDFYEIWVAEGTYVPLFPIDGSDFRTASFLMTPNARVYGGFSGTESQRSQRDPSRYLTILSGDRNGDDAAVPDRRDDNAYHVVWCPVGSSFAKIEGVTIRGGQADGPGISSSNGPDSGGGIRVDGRLAIEDCVITDNEGDYGAGVAFGIGSSGSLVNSVVFDNRGVFGGGVYVDTADTVLASIRFLGNTARFGGGLYARDNGSPVIFGCVFSGNHAVRRGGAIRFLDTTTAVIEHCTLANNTVADPDGGGAVHAQEVDFVALNSILWNNTEPGMPDGEGHISMLDGIADIDFCIVQGGAPGIGNRSQNPLFVNALGWDNEAGTLDDNLRCTYDGPGVDEGGWTVTKDVIDADSDGDTLENFPIDALGLQRVRVTRDIGAHEYDFVNAPAIRVDPGNTDIFAHGRSWTLATRLVQTALDIAEDIVHPVEVWVINGAHTPTTLEDETDARSATFRMSPGVSIVGGFNGNESSHDDRPLPLAQTLLSGDLMGDDDQGFTSDNAYRVVTLDNTDTTTSLVDLTIRGGRSTSTQLSEGGAGLRLNSGSAKLLRVRITDNHAGHGGGIFVDSNAGSLLLERCVVDQNVAAATGGGMYGLRGEVIVRDSRLLGNVATIAGGIRLVGSDTDARIVNAEILGNAGGGIRLSSGAFAEIAHATIVHNPTPSSVEAGGLTVVGTSGLALVRNSVLWGNEGASADAQDNQISLIGGGGLDADYCLVEGWRDDLPGSGSFVGHPWFIDARGADGLFGTLDDDVRLGPGSHAIDAGDSGRTPIGVTQDIAGLARFVDAVLYEDAGDPDEFGAEVDLGAHAAPSDIGLPSTTCEGDFDNDGDVDLGDFGVFGGAFGTLTGDASYNPDADFDNDGDVDLGNFGIFGGEFGRTDCLG